MQVVASAMRRLLIVIALIGVFWVTMNYYSYIFSKVVRGEVMEVERVTQPAAVMGGGQFSPEQLFSFAVLIRASDSGEIFSASSEDRQWAVARKGYCVEAQFYPYPPWNLEKANTYHNARLIKVFDCKAGLQSQGVSAAGQPPVSAPVLSPAPTPALESAQPSPAPHPAATPAVGSPKATPSKF